MKDNCKASHDVLSAHAQFGGDLELMQKAYEWRDLKAKVSELEALLAQYRDHSQPYWEARAEAAEGRLVKLEEALETIYLSFHGSNPSDAMADMPREDYLAYTLREARLYAKAALERI